MKTYFLVLGLLVLGSGVPAHCGSYLIQLKNGGQIPTRQYWESGDEITFQTSGGIVSLPKDSIETIAETASLPQANRTDPDPNAGGLTPPPAVGQEIDRKPVQDQPSVDDKPVDLSPYQAKQQELVQQLEQARQRYLDALGGKDTGIQEQARQEMVGLGKRFYDLADEVKGKNKGELPDWWKDWER